jgi:hypothetical protein
MIIPSAAGPFCAVIFRLWLVFSLHAVDVMFLAAAPNPNAASPSCVLSDSVWWWLFIIIIQFSPAQIDPKEI